MREVNRKFKDHYGNPVRVIRWEPETRRVIYPEWLAGQSLLDIALNKEWPKHDDS